MKAKCGERTIKYTDKEKASEVYELWQEAFADSAAFADYYFRRIYPRNRVLAAEENHQLLSMLHMNPYYWHFENEKHNPVLLHYIVGVATRQAYRRQGLMADCMRQALRDMEAAGEPFTYLMPAKREYYTPFGFVSLTEERIWEKLKPDCAWRLFKGQLSKGEETPFDSCSYVVNYPVRTKEYMDCLREEMLCDEGNIWKPEVKEGYAAYELDKTMAHPVIIITQLFGNADSGQSEELQKDMMKELLPVLYKQYGELPVRYVQRREIMLRVLWLEKFVSVLSYCGEDKNYYVHITDEICEANQGDFQIILSENGCRAVRLMEGVSEEPLSGMHIEELTNKLIQETGFADSLYIMETV